MANYLKRNLLQLKKSNPIIATNFEFLMQLVELFIDSKEVFFRDGKLYFIYEKKEYQLTSKKTKKEAEYLTRNLEPLKDHLVVLFGMANIELLKKLVESTTENTKIAVFEPNFDVFVYCMKNYNLSDIIASPKLGLLVGDTQLIDRQIPVYFTSSWMNLVHNIQAIMLPNYYIYRDYAAKIMKQISSEIDAALMALGNSLDDMIDGLINHYLNVDAIIEACDCSDLENKYHDQPAIVVASGPSLDKNIDDLRKAEGKALILACDASYQTCLEHGIHPEAIVSIERGIPTYNAFYKGRTFNERLVLMGPSLLWPNIHEEFPGKQLLYAKNSSGLEGWWTEMFPNSTFASMGHSCATAAYAIARKAGCDPVILVGQDLAYTDNKKHSEQVHHDSFGNANELTEEEQKGQGLWVEDIYGGKVRTSEVFNLFRHFFEDETLMEGTIIDATEGGALIRGTKIMTLKDAIQQYCNNEIGIKLYDILKEKKITPEVRLEKYKLLLKNTDEMIELLRKIQNKAVEHFHVLEKYIEFSFDTATGDELINIVMEMQKGNEVLEYLNNEGRVAYSFYQQILRQTVIYVKKIGNEITGKTVKRNWELQVNLMQMIDIASVSVGNKLEELREGIEEKKRKLEEEMAFVK